MVSFPPNFYKNIIAGNSGLSKNFLLRLNIIPEDKITLDFMEFLKIFTKFSGEILFLSSVFTSNLGINLAFAAKMHGCQGENAAKAQEILSFSVSFQWFMIKNLLL